MNATNIIQSLQMQAHPEGGYYKETYRSTETTTHTNGALRNRCTAIYYLLQNTDKSHFHRIASDELWFYHQGTTLEIYCIKDGKIEIITLGDNLENGEILQACIPANTWFAAKLKNNTGYALVSCTVAPGFDFADFELANRANLLVAFPELEKTIEEFTKY